VWLLIVILHPRSLVYTVTYTCDLYKLHSTHLKYYVANVTYTCCMWWVKFSRAPAGVTFNSYTPPTISYVHCDLYLLYAGEQNVLDKFHGCHWRKICLWIWYVTYSCNRWPPVWAPSQWQQQPSSKFNTCYKWPSTSSFERSNNKFDLLCKYVTCQTHSHKSIC
jgi:hypothetical protein